MSEELQQKIDNLTEELEVKSEKIDELEQENEGLEEDISMIRENQRDYDDAMIDQEVVAEKAFNAGHDCKDDSKLRGWLNYKLEARL